MKSNRRQITIRLTPETEQRIERFRSSQTIKPGWNESVAFFVERGLDSWERSQKSKS